MRPPSVINCEVKPFLKCRSLNHEASFINNFLCNKYVGKMSINKIYTILAVREPIFNYTPGNFTTDKPFDQRYFVVMFFSDGVLS